jgi:hypothetical protein
MNFDQTHEAKDFERHIGIGPDKTSCSDDYDGDGIANCVDAFPTFPYASFINGTQPIPNASSTGCGCGQPCMSGASFDAQACCDDMNDCDETEWPFFDTLVETEDYGYGIEKCLAIYTLYSEIGALIGSLRDGISASSKLNKARVCCGETDKSTECDDAPAYETLFVNETHDVTEFPTHVSLGLVKTCAETDNIMEHVYGSHYYGKNNIEHECMDTVDVLGHMSSDSESTVFEVWYNLHWVVLALVSVHLVVVSFMAYWNRDYTTSKDPRGAAWAFNAIVPVVVGVLTLVTTIYFGMLHDGDNVIDSKLTKFANITLAGGHGKGYEHFDFSMNDDPTDEEGIENVIMSDVMHSVPSRSEDRYTGWAIALIIAYCVQIISTVLYMIIFYAPNYAASMSQIGSSASTGAQTRQPTRSIYASASKLAF